ncbi:MAG: hypothetical protein ACYTEL_26455 [Planctomycetota bacterium]
MIYTTVNDPEPVIGALGRFYYDGALDEAEHSGGRTWRFEIDYQLYDSVKEGLKHPNPGMAGFTEVGPNATNTLRKQQDAPW